MLQVLQAPFAVRLRLPKCCSVGKGHKCTTLTPARICILHCPINQSPPASCQPTNSPPSLPPQIKDEVGRVIKFVGVQVDVSNKTEGRSYTDSQGVPVLVHYDHRWAPFSSNSLLTVLQFGGEGMFCRWHTFTRLGHNCLDS